MATKDVLPIDQQLVENLRKAKGKVSAANQELTEAQYAIFESVKDKLPPKGTTHFTGLKVVTDLYEKWSQEKLDEIEKTWVRKCNLPFPFKKVFKEDNTALKYIKEQAPDGYKALEESLTTSDAKPKFEIIEPKEKANG